MPNFNRLSDVLGIKAKKLEGTGVFNGYVGFDSPVFIDPKLLSASAAPEFQQARARIDEYFERVFKLIRNIHEEGDPFWKKAKSLLKFRERPNLSIGLSSEDSAGRGIGDGLAVEILRLARRIVSAGIEDTTIFELMGLFGEGIGPDLISDMVAHICYADILSYSQRISQSLALATTSISYNGSTYSIATKTSSNVGIPFLPKDVLSDIPISENWSDRDIVAAQNAEIRESLNKVVGATWRKATNQLKKTELREILLKNPSLLKDLIWVYQKKAPKGYDFAADPEGYFQWEDIATDFTGRFPLKFESASTGALRIVEFSSALCLHFKRLTEKNGLAKLLYKENGSRRKEEFLQLLFLAIALTYAEPHGFKVSREVNAGRGPVDFQISLGAAQVVNIELKFSDNPKLEHGMKVQTEIYNDAENTSASIYLVAQVTKYAPPQLKKLSAEMLLPKSYKRPRLIIVDAVIRPSASKSP